MSTPQQHDDLRGTGLLGAYVLGALDQLEVEAVEAHLIDCVTCRAEVAELRGLEEMLGELPVEAFLDGPPEGGDLMLQRTLRQVRAEREGKERRRWVTVGAAAAVAAAVVLGGGVLLGRGTAAQPVALPSTPAVTAPATPQPGPVASATDRVTGARMTVSMTPAAGWVRLDAAVTGVPQGQKCHLVVVGKDGSTEVAGGWLVSPAAAQHGVNLNGSALMAASDIASVRVENTAGKVFVDVSV